MTSANGWPMPGNKPKMPHAVRPAAQLHPADDLALPQRGERDAAGSATTVTSRIQPVDDRDVDGRASGQPQARSMSSRTHASCASVRRPAACGLRASAAATARGARRASTWYMGTSTHARVATAQRRSTAMRARDTCCGCDVAAQRAQLFAHFFGRLIVEARQVQQIAEHAQHLPARARFAERRGGARRSSARGLRDSRRCRRSRRTCRWAAARARSLAACRSANGVMATTKLALPQRLRAASPSSASSPGLDAAEQHIGLLRLREHLARVHARRADGLDRPASRCGTRAGEIGARGIAAFGEHAERGAGGLRRCAAASARRSAIRRMPQRQRAEPDRALLPSLSAAAIARCASSTCAPRTSAARCSGSRLPPLARGRDRSPRGPRPARAGGDSRYAATGNR